MKILTTRSFEKDYQGLPEEIKKRTDKKLTLLLENPRHPSLRIKKMQGYPNLWEGRITRNYRFIFTLEGDVYLLYRLGSHDVLENPCLI